MEDLEKALCLRKEEKIEEAFSHLEKAAGLFLFSFDGYTLSLFMQRAFQRLCG